MCSSKELESHYKERAKYKSRREKLMMEQQNRTLPARCENYITVGRRLMHRLRDRI